ncbi:MAG: LLM class flavin-dependent oxidoreductase [Acidimicrobiia bacterium]|nr:LLM class flavin-dependent oxidoreductase [Acidimicrobiia bacterium]
MRFGASFFMQNYGDWGRYADKAYDTAPARSDTEVYDESVYLANLVEPLGFDSIWTVEHHFTPYTMVPNPLQFLTYMAGRTERVDFGTMVIVLPWHDPIRVAEEIAMLDVLAGGRKITLGFGRGAGRVEFEGFRTPMGESRDRFLESLEVVRAALSNQEFSFEGEFHQIPAMSIRPQPRSTDLVERMYCAWGSPETIPIAANAGLGALFIPQKGWEEIGEEVVTYNDIRQQAGLAAQQPIVVCWVYCSPDPDEAWETARRYMTNYNDSALRHYEFHDAEHFKEAGGYDFYAKMADARKRVGEEKVVEVFARNQVWGTPEQCIEKLRTIRATTDAAEFVGVFTYGDLPVELAEASMRLFAEEVLPVLHADEAAEVAVTD